MAALPALLLERIACSKQFVVNVHEIDTKTTAALLSLLDDGLITPGDQDYGLGWEHYHITGRGSDVRSGLMLQLAPLSPGACVTSGDVALWVWLLLHGGTVPQYAAEPELSSEVLHLLVCGLDLARSGSVRDGSWDVFAGTFCDDERHTGVSGLATCWCGEVSELRLVAEVSSVTELLHQVLDQ